MTKIVAFYDRGVAWVGGRIPEGLALFLLRVALAGVFWRSGQTKLIEGGFLQIDPSQYDLFASEFSGLPLAPAIAVPVTVFAEHLFPALLLLGLATRGAAAALLVMTLVIQLFVFPDAWWPVHSLWAGMAAILIVRGGGLFSLDALAARLRHK
ncbi:DoxX family protein [Sphingopyxis sp. RIFCSPHIGHO2_12_FULL_65_19]|uniref:DoxX family protein n=1 Tax=Sphingopyxis sp. RIFCSPHIGHO2_12_FULL_65_19 TaxID=1802172 RepID=UPI0008CA9B6D|nr:DoxX family protein [Sphingopyxis sp. RIFCSPHIGHO2_12_FULL_65_19]OHD09851.1 MAG: DoxX protein [Sphingopyxis sp. RIFCSPHIGHO2_12_FULL_65_19]